MRASKYTVKPTSQFKKDYKLAMKQRTGITRSAEIGMATGNVTYSDWLLIYKLEDNVLILTLARTGTHSNLFNK